MFPKIFHISTNYNEDYFNTLIDMYLEYRIERICTRFIIQVLIQMGIGILNELKLQCLSRLLNIIYTCLYIT